ncbi:MAG: YdbH domain-containing protein, partial [Hyphomonadaceae bacterium]|nr:YdbH domain-containing protein [Hyphomonadaceae bacterium]
QEHPAPQGPDDPPPARRLLIGWTTALAALGLSTAGVAAAVWFLRFPIASFFIGAALAERGVEADFQVVNLDLNHITIVDLRFGAAPNPDAASPRIDARWTWSGLTPRLSAVRVQSPRLRLRLDEAGHVSAGALDRLRSGPPGSRRPAIPSFELEIVDGAAAIAAPFGDLNATFQSSGVIGHDFQATAHIAESTLVRGPHALERGRADLIVASRDNVLAARLTASAGALTWAGVIVDDAQLRITVRAPLDLARYEGEAAWRVAALRSDQVNAEQLSGTLGGEAITEDNSLAPRLWQGQARFNAARFSAYDNALQSARFDARFDGEGGNGDARWSLAGENYDGLAMLAPRATAAGTLRFSFDGAAEGAAQISLSQARLNNDAQDAIRDAFPNIESAPIGPTFAAAERALDVAADRFDLTAPLGLVIDESGTRLRLAAPVEARAASGAALRLTPLRDDAPALVIQWPGAALHGAVALELSGGGAPTASLLLDTVDWSPGAPFEADGTITLSDWRAAGASIAANELAIAIAIAPQGDGRIDLRGPAQITGPIGEGQVRDMVASLDLAVTWRPGWRVTPNGCTPIRMSGLDAAGFSFGNGAFALCPLNGALIAADANERLSGGFIIRSLGLNGRMAGPDAQPARLGAANVIGQFRGSTGDVTLLLEAETPRLQIELGDARTLALFMQRMTANARIHDGAWRVDGAFESGTLEDPNLPGAVSTIEGQWDAVPQGGDDGPVITVRSGAALLTAYEPESETERPLFNPMRLADVSAVVRGGHVDAQGAIVLDASSRQLAAFTAFHDISEGAGSTRILATDIVFDETLQPYNITERTRGMVENVRGTASMIADVRWTHDALTATGTLSTDGVSFATATMPVIQDVRGSVYFDDLFNLTTPPGQSATVGLLNPGLAARNGRLRFQLLSEQRLSIEHAEFEFAGGVLAMAPTTMRLGEDETRIELTLRDVDAADLIANLNIPDLAATGLVEGSFPIRLTRQTAFIEGGVLRSQGEGGILSYTGTAGEEVEGLSRIAFDALRSFRYDNLVLTLDGDLNGDVISSIQFSGRNSGRPVELGDMTDIPGVGSVTVRGVPFDFNVRIAAPFRALARTATTITDPAALINRANGEVTDTRTEIDIVPPAPPELVDPASPGTR